MTTPEDTAEAESAPSFARQLAAGLPPGFTLPEPIARLYAWVEGRGFLVETASGETIGVLQAPDDDDSPGTRIELGCAVPDEHWLQTSDAAAQARLVAFAQCGAEGSQAAFWLDDDGHTNIVHLGSGSGSLLACVLAREPVDFLRLLAIGYDEICWPEDLATPPASVARGGPPPNPIFRRWVEKSFGVSIPAVGTEIVRHLAEIDDEDSPDPFCRWVTQVRRAAPPPPSPHERARQARAERRARARPMLCEGSRRYLQGGAHRDGQTLQGDCPACGARGELRVCEGAFVLCWACYWKF